MEHMPHASAYIVSAWNSAHGPSFSSCWRFRTTTCPVDLRRALYTAPPEEREISAKTTKSLRVSSSHSLESRLIRAELRTGREDGISREGASGAKQLFKVKTKIRISANGHSTQSV